MSILPLIFEIGDPSRIIPSVPELSIKIFPPLFSTEPLISMPFVPLLVSFILPFSFFKDPDWASLIPFALSARISPFLF